MVLTLQDLIKHFETLKLEGWTRFQCEEGGLDLDSDYYIEGGSSTERKALDTVFGK